MTNADVNVQFLRQQKMPCQQILAIDETLAHKQQVLHKNKLLKYR